MYCNVCNCNLCDLHPRHTSSADCLVINNKNKNKNINVETVLKAFVKFYKPDTQFIACSVSMKRSI